MICCLLLITSIVSCKWLIHVIKENIIISIKLYDTFVTSILVVMETPKVKKTSTYDCYVSI